MSILALILFAVIWIGLTVYQLYRFDKRIEAIKYRKGGFNHDIRDV